MRLRNASAALKRLQHRLRCAQHTPQEPYVKALVANFWDKVRIDKRIARGEL